MNPLVSLLSRVPGVAKYLILLLLGGAALGFVYFNYGLASTLVLLGGLLLVLICVLVWRKFLKRKERQQGLAFGKALEDAQRGPTREAVRQAVTDLSGKWNEAMGNLRTTRIDVYQLPWYMLIGEPQSGKSTTLKFSGLNFPIGKESISGGGGTRNCDWWFTDQGVILDTAGRFTFHDQSRPDAAEWDYFLALLAKHRKYCPINGVILVIPVDALLEISSAELEEKAANIGEQLRLIQNKLAIQFPIYVMVTKCDKVYGFVDFFNKLTPDQQREMFGWSCPDEASGFDPTIFDESYKQLTARIEVLRFQHFSQPQYLDDLGKTYTFLEELRTLQTPLRQYLEIIFKPTVYKDPLLFRGYYLSSGMQEGQPLVSACKKMLPSTSMIKHLEEIFTKSRAFFVRDFYGKKVFPEEGLVRRASQHQSLDTLKRRVVLTGNIVMLILGLLFVWGLHRDLSSSLSRPMEAIDSALTTLDVTQGTFFDSKGDREQIYQALTRLKTDLDEKNSGGFFAMFRGDRNAMTEPLDASFAYLYLDRFLQGLFHETNDQLRNFRLKAPARPRNSERELTTLLAALSELKKWQVKVAEGEADDFEPSIRPFLDLALDSAWDGELAGLRGDRPLAEELDAWFNTVYANNAPGVQKFLIARLVGLTKGIYLNLDERVLAFYNDQPELRNYGDKRNLLEQLASAYANVGRPAGNWELQDERMVSMATFFDDDKRALISGADGYLSFNQLRERTIDSLGAEFTDMRPQEKSLSIRDKNHEKERRKLPEAIPFVNVLISTQIEDLNDPRAGQATGEGTSLGYPPVVEDFWTRVLEPYMAHRVQIDPYGQFPVAGNNLDENVEGLFTTGQARVKLLHRLLQDDLQEHLRLVEDRDTGKRFESTINNFYDDLVKRERNQISTALGTVLNAENLKVKNPPRQWSRYLSEFRSLGGDGHDFSGFTTGPKRVLDLLANNQRQIRDIYPESSQPDDVIKTYVGSVHSRLSAGWDVLTDLDRIGQGELAGNKAKYAGKFQGIKTLQNMAAVDNVPVFLQAHRRSLEAWSNAAIVAFRGRVGAADPCPNCPRELNALRDSVAAAGSKFPMSFNGQVNQTRVGEGELGITVRMVDKKLLDDVFNALEIYRSPNPLQRAHLRKNGVEKLIAEALVWADGVRDLREGKLSAEFVVGGQDDSESSVANYVVYANLSGAWQSRTKILLNSGSLTGIERNPKGTGEVSELRFYNDDPGNRTEAKLSFDQGFMGFIAYALDGAVQNETRITREIALELNLSNRKVVGSLDVKTSQPIPQPPDWNRLLGN